MTSDPKIIFFTNLV
jgi:hypothetical protein